MVLDQGGDRRVARAPGDEAAFSVRRQRAIVRIRRSLSQQCHRVGEANPAGVRLSLRALPSSAALAASLTPGKPCVADSRVC